MGGDLGDAVQGGWRFGVFTAMLAVAAPLTAAVHGMLAQNTELELARVSKAKELELATREQDFKMRMEFLDRAIDARRTPEDRQQVLRFLRAVSADEALKLWAEAELASVQEDVDSFREARDQLASALARESELTSKQAGASSPRVGTSGQPTASELEKADAERDVARARKRVETLQNLRALDLQTQLGGSVPNVDTSAVSGERKSHEAPDRDLTK